MSYRSEVRWWRRTSKWTALQGTTKNLIFASIGPFTERHYINRRLVVSDYRAAGARL